MSFKDLKLIEPLLRAVAEQGYTVPTPIQSASIPPLLEGHDLIGIAQTGTGKTAAFVLPILQRLSEKYPRKVRVLVLAPTRELAAQIGESFSAYGKFMKFKHTVIFGGVGQGNQVSALHRGVDIIVATPGRLLDLMEQKFIDIHDIEFFVLDEADRMLDMGFIHDIRKVIAKLPVKRQSLFFSATMSRDVDDLARGLLTSPVHVAVAEQATTVDKVSQQVFFVDSGSKDKLLLDLLRSEEMNCVLVFTKTKHRANKLAEFLDRNGVRAAAIHGNKSQTHRTAALREFKEGKVRVLVATDIAARGIDIENISHVVNFELPNIPESYVHRIGRTARAGAAGTAISFCAADEREFLRDIERLIRQQIDQATEHTNAYHSNTAQNATGSAARPPPGSQGGGRRGGRFGGGRGKFQGGGSRGGSRPRQESDGRARSEGERRYQKRPHSNDPNRSHGTHRAPGQRSRQDGQRFRK